MEPQRIKVRTKLVAVDVELPGCRTDDSSFITKPITPMALMPSRHIFIDSHSSLLPGLIANLSVLAHCARKSLKPMSIAFSILQSDNNCLLESQQLLSLYLVPTRLLF
jgi:hypothetical protein